MVRFLKLGRLGLKRLRFNLQRRVGLVLSLEIRGTTRKGYFFRESQGKTGSSAVWVKVFYCSRHS
jgi:hypothetical protein